MPFTFAHPAIVLPFIKLPRRLISLTALVIGSMVPDFEYFLRLRNFSEHSHTLSGLFYFDLPIGLLLFVLFVHVVREPLVIHLPAFLRARLVGVRWTPCNRGMLYWLVIAVSLLLGAVSHILWDGFTHKSGYFVEQIPFLQQNILAGKYEIPVFKILQHSSTVIGFIAVAAVVLMLPVKEIVAAQRNPRFWSNVALSVAIVLIIKYVFSPQAPYADFIVAAISGFLAGLVVGSTVSKKATVRWWNQNKVSQ